MNITTRMERLEGVEKAYWTGSTQKLTIFYKDIPLNVARIRVAKALADVQLQDSVKLREFRR